MQFQQNELAEAHATSSRASAALPDHLIVLYHLGRTAQALGRADEARRHLERALAQGGDSAELEAAREALEQLR